MTSQIRKISIKKLKEFNIILTLQLQVPSKELTGAGCTLSLILNLLNLGVGLGNWVPSIKFKKGCTTIPFWSYSIKQPSMYYLSSRGCDNILQ